MKTDKEILSEITTIAERWVMGRENDDESMHKIARILRNNNMLKIDYINIINTSTKNEY